MNLLHTLLAVSTLLLSPMGVVVASEKAASLPNILWLSSEDHGPHMGCYGDSYATTPHVDALAAKGMIFQRAWSCGPVCAAARTTIISGLYPQSLGAEHMRSEVPFPSGFRMYPQFLRDAGYYCTNNNKEDYNLTKPGQVWDESSLTPTAATKARSAHALIHRSMTPQKSGSRPITRTPQRSAKIGLNTTTSSRKPMQMPAANSPNWQPQGSPKTPSFFIGPITAQECHAANAGLPTPGCTCRWWFISQKNGGTLLPQNTLQGANRTVWFHSWTSRPHF
jgi:arylsulfatase A-like enzyme